MFPDFQQILAKHLNKPQAVEEDVQPTADPLDSMDAATRQKYTAEKEGLDKQEENVRKQLDQIKQKKQDLLKKYQSMTPAPTPTVAPTTPAPVVPGALPAGA